MSLAQENRILSLIGTEPDGLKSIEIQKLMFIFTKEEEAIPSYDFIPYKQGGYSPTLAHDLHRLAEKGFLKPEVYGGKRERIYSLTEDGEIRLFENRVSATLFASFRNRYRLRGTELVADVYRRYPYWAINSEIKDIVLEGDEDALRAIDSAKPTSSLPLASIGYEGRTFENYLNALVKNNITILCDVRKNPISRKYGFSKSTLQNACQGLGIEYRHFPELGIPSYERAELRYQSDYDALFARYEEKILPHAEESVDILARLVMNDAHIALTCYEANPSQCHRTRVLNAITQKTGVKATLI